MPILSVYGIAYDCTRAFGSLVAKCTSSIGNESDQRHALSTGAYFEQLRNDCVGIKRLSNRFDVWANYSGALAMRERCLDRRLESFADIKDMIVELLRMLQRAMCRLCEFLPDHVPSDQLRIALSDSNLTKNKAWNTASFSIDQLSFLASVVRNSAVNSQKYDLSTHIPTEEDLYFEEQITRLIRIKFPLARRSLCEHLGSSIAYRRRLISRMQFHEDKLKRKDADAIRPSLGSDAEEINSRAGLLSNTSLRLPPGNTLHLRTPFSGSTGSASSLQRSEVNKRLKGGRALTAISVGTSIHISSCEYPEPPISDECGEHFPCPYCGAPLPTDISDLQWRKHVNKDIEPYVCLSESCTSPFLLFVDKSSWLNHMSSAHTNHWPRTVHTTTWYCDVDHDGGEVPFNDRQSFLEHFERSENHPKRSKPNQSQLQALLRTKQRVLIREDRCICPFCDASFTESDIFKVDLKTHISEHLLEVAFYSITNMDISSNVHDVPRPSIGSWASGRKRDVGSMSHPVPPSGYDLLDPLTTVTSITHDVENQERSLCISHALDGVQETHHTHWDDIGYKATKEMKQRSGRPSFDPIIAHLRQLQLGIEFSFGDLILGNMMESRFDSPQEFLPEGSIEKIVDYQIVAEELFDAGKSLSSDDESLVEFIWRHSRKVFATAFYVLNDKERLLETMRYFRSRSFTDTSLPMRDLQRAGPARDSRRELPFPFEGALEGRISRIWRPLYIRNFYKTQWKFLAPVFNQDVFHHILSPDSILPFTWVSNVSMGGKFSEVREVRIHRAHYSLPSFTANDVEASVAIKEMYTTEDDDVFKREVEKNFEVEANALSGISSLTHNHIIERIAAITRGSKHYFIFQWADGGSLREFWRDNPSPSLDADLLHQSVAQLRGLADALEAIHHYSEGANYRHGDLKPENILRVKNEAFVGTLKIANLGMAKRHTEATEARLEPTSARFSSTRYEPPEVITNRLNARSRLHDVWSLGCIILEYMIWLLYGYSTLQEFDEDILRANDCFYLIESEEGRLKARVHPTVVCWMDKISRHPQCSSRTATRHLLELVRNRLLIVALSTGSDRSLSSFGPISISIVRPYVPQVPVGRYRAKAATVCSALQDILNSGAANERYWFANK